MWVYGAGPVFDSAVNTWWVMWDIPYSPPLLVTTFPGTQSRLIKSGSPCHNPPEWGHEHRTRRQACCPLHHQDTHTCVMFSCRYSHADSLIHTSKIIIPYENLVEACFTCSFYFVGLMFKYIWVVLGKFVAVVGKQVDLQAGTSFFFSYEYQSVPLSCRINGIWIADMYNNLFNRWWPDYTVYPTSLVKK